MNGKLFRRLVKEASQSFPKEQANRYVPQVMADSELIASLSAFVAKIWATIARVMPANTNKAIRLTAITHLFCAMPHLLLLVSFAEETFS